jgi:hypothetical protein
MNILLFSSAYSLLIPRANENIHRSFSANIADLDDYPDILDRESKNPFRLLSVLDLLKQQNPGVSAIRFPYISEEEEWDPDFDWEAAGQCVGESPFIKYLSIRFEPSTCSMGLIPFCRVLANNRSIIRLDMYIHFHDYGPEKNVMFTILRPSLQITTS